MTGGLSHDAGGGTGPGSTGVKVLAGLRVLEVAHFAYVPSAGAVLSDWGADVIKVENPATGDPMRGVTIAGVPPGTEGFTFMWEMANRGKRSVSINLASEDGHALLLELAATADVFLTSFLPGVQQKLRVTEDDIRAVNPTIIYASGTGQGEQGPEADTGGFDQISFWYRAGVASALAPIGERPIDMPGPGFGDVLSGLSLAGGIAAALVHRATTGEGLRVSGSLLATGMWAMQPGLAATELLGRDELRAQERTETANPLVNTFRTLDGRYVGLCVVEPDKYWPELCVAIGRADLVDDPRFHDQDARAAHAAECVAELDQVFATKTLADWEQVLATQRAQWSVVRRAGEVRDDQQVRHNGYLRGVDYGGGRRIDLVPAPVQHGGAPAELRPAPTIGAHTQQVLAELGVDDERLRELREQGVVR